VERRCGHERKWLFFVTVAHAFPGVDLAMTGAGGFEMAKDRTNQGGPTWNPKDAPVPDRDTHRKATSRDELKDRTSDGSGEGRRNGSDKNR
jgi:hypothetical protein